MRLMILRMISASSLQAFSAANSSGPNAVSQVHRPGAVHRARALEGQSASSLSARPPQVLKNLPAPGQDPPSRALPRGSLLDVSV